MRVSEHDLKQFILDSGLVSRKDVDSADEEAERRRQSIGDILVSQGLLSTDALRRVKSYVLGIPFISLKGRSIPLETLSLIPEPVSRAHSIVAIARTEQGLEIALLDTHDLTALESMQRKTRLKFLPRLTDEESLKHALLHYQKSLKEEFGDLIAAEVLRAAESNSESADTNELAQDLSIVRIVDTVLRHAVIQGASDIHIDPLETEVLVRYRINGALHDAMVLPVSVARGMIARLKTLAHLDLEQQLMPQDGRFTMETERDRVSLRLSLMPTYFGEKAVLRVLRQTGEGFTLDVLGFHGSAMERIHGALRERGGLILVAGPEKSGKTTTLYTLLDILNTPDVNIATIEHPIEYQLKRVNQTQINQAIGLSYAAGLRAILRQDPDVVMVGEIKDAETAHVAIEAALSGRLVLASINAKSASAAINRLERMDVDSSVLASTLRLVIGQRLVRKLCDPKDAHTLTKAQRAKVADEEAFTTALKMLADEKLVKTWTHSDQLPFYIPQPSEASEDGYLGQIALQEIISVSPVIRDLLEKGAGAAKIETQARKEGSTSLVEDGIYKAVRGVTSLEEVARALTP